MPITGAEAAIIGAGLNAAVAGGNMYSQGRMNKRTEKYNERMYFRNRADALADWNMQNDYNSPTAQMQRFRDAGLNPNLIYGQTNEGATVRSTDQQAWNPRAPQFEFDAGSVMGAYYDTKLKEAQTDNLRAANTVAVNQAALLAAQTAQTGANTARSQFDLGLAQDLRATSLETAQASLRKLNTETDISLQQNDRNAVITASNLREATERITKLRLEQANTSAEKRRIEATIQGIIKDNSLKEYDLKLRAKGINPNDPMWIRMITQFMDDKIEGLKSKARELKPENFLKGLQRFSNP